MLHETSNDIELRYQAATLTEAYYTGGASATVGIQADTSSYLEYSCETAALHDGLVILFTTCPEPLGDMDGDGLDGCLDCDDGDSSVTPIETRERGGKHERLWAFLVSPVPELSLGERRRVLTVCFTYFCFHLVMNGVLVGSLGYLMSQRLPSGAMIMGVALGIATLNGFLISTRWIVGLAAPIFGYVGDRHGREKVVIGALPVCVVGLALLAVPSAFTAAVVWLPLAFGAVAAAITALDSTIGGLAPRHRRARVVSRYATWQDVGSAIGPLAAYAVLDFASLTLVYLTGAAVLVVALAVFTFVFRAQVEVDSMGDPRT